MTCCPFLPIAFTAVLRQEILLFSDKFKREVKGVMKGVDTLLTVENLQKQIAPTLTE